MRHLRSIPRMAAFVASLLATFQPLRAAQPLATPECALAGSAVSRTVDLELADQGVLRGRLLNASNAPVAMAEVMVVREGRVVGRSRTGADGHFLIPDLPAGVCHVVCQSAGNDIAHASYRLWEPGTAPPAAVGSTIIYSQQTIVRGQHHPGGVFRFLSRPWVTAVLVTAAVAIPIAVSNSDDDSAS